MCRFGVMVIDESRIASDTGIVDQYLNVLCSGRGAVNLFAVRYIQLNRNGSPRMLIDEILYAGNIASGDVDFFRPSSEGLFCDSASNTPVSACYKYNCVLRTDS